MLKYRPFVSSMVAREVRRHATRRLNAKQFTQDQHDQFSAKMRTKMVIEAVCDFLEAEEGFNTKNLNKHLMSSWSKLRDLVDEFPDVNLNKPEMLYNMASKSNRRQRVKRYQEDREFVADRDAYREEQCRDSY